MPTVKIYQDDPAIGTLIDAEVPNVGDTPFPFQFPVPEQPKDADPDSIGFRYWNAAVALRRGVNFWHPAVSVKQWHRGNTPLPVFLDRGEDLNSNYNRQSLNFYHGKLQTGQQVINVFTAASPDLLCHELGHAILDSIKPQLFNPASQEIAAFHESFGDMSAILCSLQIDAFRNFILTDTGGNLFTNSRLSRIAEQFGAAVRAVRPARADPDCLRNAFNQLNYFDPANPPAGSSFEPHLFSRIFTGALLEAMAGMFASITGNGQPDSNELLETTRDMRRILVEAVKNTGVVSNYFAQVATSIVQESSLVRGRDHSEIFRSIFVRRGIMSPQTASVAMSRMAFHERGLIARLTTGHSKIVELSSVGRGLDRALLVSAPASPRRFIAKSALPDSTEIEPQSPISAAKAYVDDLFADNQVQLEPLDRNQPVTGRPKSHYLMRIGRYLCLKRLSFN